jgi:hypothetical protein
MSITMNALAAAATATAALAVVAAVKTTFSSRSVSKRVCLIVELLVEVSGGKGNVDRVREYRSPLNSAKVPGRQRRQVTRWLSFNFAKPTI